IYSSFSSAGAALTSLMSSGRPFLMRASHSFLDRGVSSTAMGATTPTSGMSWASWEPLSGSGNSMSVIWGLLCDGRVDDGAEGRRGYPDGAGAFDFFEWFDVGEAREAGDARP